MLPMATTTIIPLHGHIGKSVKNVIADTTNYVKNSRKTENEKYVSCYECTKETIVNDFMTTKQMYEMITGRVRNIVDDVVGYMVRQSFLPGEVSPELANKIGYQLAKELTQGQHQFIVGTHTDKHHIHNHAVINSTALDCTSKWNNKRNSYEEVRKISDKLCKEYGLSIVEKPKEKGKSYKEWDAEKKGDSWKAKLKEAIDIALCNCNTFDEFLNSMRSAGYEIKQNKHISFRAIGQERFTRAKSLGENYTEQAIRNSINQKKNRTTVNQNINLIIDIQARLQSGKGKGYEQWATIFNLKEAAKTLNYLVENNITDRKALEENTTQTFSEYNKVSKKIKQTEYKMNEIAKLKNHIIQFAKTKNTYLEYKKSKNPESFRAEHEKEILLHEAAKQAFNAQNLKKLPTVSSLQKEYIVLLETKNTLYTEYKELRNKWKEQQTLQQNIEKIMQIPKKEIQKSKSEIER